MIERGSLRQCMMALASRWDQGCQDHLAIICNPAGKYYTLGTLVDVRKANNGNTTDRRRVVFFGSRREFYSFVDHDQIEIPLGGNTDASPHTDPAG